MDTATATHIHPTFNAILAGVQAMPAQMERAKYVSRLISFDWTHEISDDASVVRRGQAELAELKALRERIDSDHTLWNRHAPEWAATVTTVHEFSDFTGNAPVMVEWVATMMGPRVIAVVVDTARGPCAIQADLSAKAMERYQAKAAKLGTTVRAVA